MAKLGVNIDHVATLRQARREGIPDIVKAAKAVAAGGADSITVHLRLDRRHINEKDVYRLKNEDILPLNLEMAASGEIIEIALDVRPAMVCIVPEKRQELTTEGGLDVASHRDLLRETASKLKEIESEVSFFVDPSVESVREAASCGADAVELHTGRYANTSGSEREAELEKLKTAAAETLKLGMKLNAGHGLNYDNLVPVRDIEGMNDLNIGYSIVCRSVFTGLENAVREMAELIR